MNQAISNSSSPLVLNQFKYRRDLGLLFDPSNGNFKRLENEVAREIIEHLIAGKIPDEIVPILAEGYDENPDTIRKDIEEFVAELNVEVSHDNWYSVDKGFSDPLSFPIRMEIELTAVCNWNCGFCYNVWKIDPSLTDDQVRQKIRLLPVKHLPKTVAFSILDQCAEGGCFTIRYSGGEPTLHPDFWPIIEHGAGHKFYQVLFTNGHFVDDVFARQLVGANVRTVLISLHGDGDTHRALTGRADAYDKARSAIRCCIQAGIEVVVEATLVKRNKDHIVKMAESCYADGANEFRVMRYVPTGKNDAEFSVSPEESWNLMKELAALSKQNANLKFGWPCAQKVCMSTEDKPIDAMLDQFNKLRTDQLMGHCESGLVWGSISYDAKLRNCPHSNVYHANLLTQQLSNGWRTMTKRVSDVLIPRESCGNCDWLSSCRGGCHLKHFLLPAHPSIN